MDNEKIVFETFQDVGQYEVNNMTTSEPTCFNGNVRVRKYRITIETVDEPEEVIAERIQKMWDECNNMHHREPLRSAAKKVGLKL